MGSHGFSVGSHGFSVGTQTVHFWVLRGFSGRHPPSGLLYNSANVTSDDKGSTHILVVALAPSLGTNYSATQRVRHQTDSLLTTRVAFLAGIAARFLRVISSVWGRFINAWCWLLTAVLQKRDVTSWNATLLELIYCHVTCSCVVVTYRGSSLSARVKGKLSK